MVGSLGTLGAIASVTFRLYPIPQATRAVVVHFQREASVSDVVRAIIARRLEPESVALYNYDALVVTFAGTQAGVDAQLRTLCDQIAPGCGVRAVELTRSGTRSVRAA